MIPPNDLAARLGAALRPEDLRLSGASLTRRISAEFKDKAGVVRFRRVAGDRATLLVFLRTEDYGDGRPFFLFAASGRVRAVLIPLTGDYGAVADVWRRQGDRIVGYLNDVQGNWSTIGVALLTRRNEAWRLTAFRETEGESSGAAFLGAGVDPVRVSTRSYDSRRIRQAHVGPLLIRDSIWRIRDERIAAGRSHLRRTPLEALDRFADAILGGEGPQARALCASGTFARARRLVREAVNDEGRLSVWCPRSVEFDEGRFLGFGGDPETFFVFEPCRGSWRIAGFRSSGSFPRSQNLQRPR